MASIIWITNYYLNSINSIDCIFTFYETKFGKMEAKKSQENLFEIFRTKDNKLIPATYGTKKDKISLLPLVHDSPLSLSVIRIFNISAFLA